MLTVDLQPLIRSGAAWTLGEYSSWIASSGQETLVPTIQGLLSVALDNNKHTQGNAITAFGYLAKEAAPSGALQAYLPSITQSFVAAFGKYQSRNVVKLYNALAHLSDGLGAAGLSDPAVLESLMPPIIERWQAFSDEEDDFRYLLEVRNTLCDIFLANVCVSASHQSLSLLARPLDPTLSRVSLQCYVRGCTS